ncbi:hypothetical protein HCN44_003336 [Aphidius gifuensis]|uniref:LisH domain-containing protein n=1 Tax=Aphidius gifuensis TaxID=684658 RepID=A0A834Y0F7_APHGI|nr:RAB11-binding protein RELCH homolog [Aphidius gifuensis]KAF7994246.1 hypothetical protein HCN44_003336 [Aphidius gifuensis]
MDNNLETDTTTVSSTSQKLLTYNEIAKKLLNEKLLLTALELHAELCESGKELPILRDYFTNTSNFEIQNIKPEPLPRSSSQVTLDSLDMTRYSEDGGTDERVAILEFELRKARDNITALRENLTVVAETENVITNDKIIERNINADIPIKPHEQRSINFLVYEYLLSNLYKLTSITFSDENENQDFEHWDDVGLNIPKPPDLLQIYREFLRGNGYEKPISHEICVQTDFNDNLSSESENISQKNITDELEILKNQVLSLEKINLDLENRLSLVTSTTPTIKTKEKRQSNDTANQNLSSNSTTPDKFEILESPTRGSSEIECTENNEEEEEDSSISAVVSLGDTDPGDNNWTKLQLPRMDVTIDTPTLTNSPSRILPFKLKREILSHCLTITPKINNLNESLIDTVTLSLQKIIPNIIPNKRDESIPLILNTICKNNNSIEREKLLQLLFNLKKKPQDNDRRLLLSGLIGIVKIDNTPPYLDEILTVAWEQSQHKYPERRLLAAECCANLAPYATSSVRNSLMLSMLQQMLVDDKESIVKSSVVKSLSLLFALMDDAEKYYQCEELALTALDDNSNEVFEPTSKILFPILAQWALSLNKFITNLLPRLLKKLKIQLLPNQQTPNKNYHRDTDKFYLTINVLQILLPHTIVCIVNNDIVKSSINDTTSSDIPRCILSLCHSSMSNPNIFFNDNENIGILINTFLNISWNNNEWNEYKWLSDKFIPEIIDMIKLIDIHQDNVLNLLINYIQCLCIGFGKIFTNEKIKKLFEIEIKELEDQLMDLSSDIVIKNLTLIPAYLTILSTIDISEMSKILKHFIIILSMSNYDSTCLILTVKILVKNIQIVDNLLTTLWDCVVHQRPIVRTTSAKLFSVLIKIVNERLVTSRIAPAIVTLASDSDLMVKSEAIIALGKLITEAKLIREAKDKGRLTLETIVKEPQGIPSVLLIPIVTTLAHIAPNCPQHFVEDIIATQLTVITSTALQQNRRVDLAGVLLDAYSILVYCSLSDKCVFDILLPGLRYLDNLIEQLIPQKKDIVRSLIREAESRQNHTKTIERSSSTSSGLSLSLATANVGQGVEDMRQRMSKIFTQKPSSPSLPSIFRKK